MNSYFLALPLTPTLRTRLASFCYGLPEVRWLEKDSFYIIVHSLGALTTLQLEEVQDHLKDLFFNPFHVSFDKISIQNNTKNRKGRVFLELTPHPAIEFLRKEILFSIRNSGLQAEEKTFSPYVTLGYFEKLNSQNIFDYLTTYSDSHFLSIEVSKCLLLFLRQTPKKIFYEIISEYSATLPFHDI